MIAHFVTIVCICIRLNVLILYIIMSTYFKVQDIEFIQIELKVIEGLKVGNACLKSMHEVSYKWTPLLLVLPP